MLLIKICLGLYALKSSKRKILQVIYGIIYLVGDDAVITQTTQTQKT